MKISEYEKAENLLHSNGKFVIKLGLERISAILDILGNPQDKIRVIHIAGTNGKGSVCSMTAEILKSAGYKTGLYTSPHLYKYNERFKINGQDISDEDFCFYVNEVNETANKHKIDLTEFEILTAAAYKYFYDKKVDFAVMETGLGGRFDAVNVVKNPVLTAITSISIDHKDRLGDTTEKIAFEKAGIIKNNSPTAVNIDNRGFETIKNVALKQNSELFTTDKKVEILYENGINYACFDNNKFEFNLMGLHQKQNLSLVLKIVDILRANGVKINEEHLKTALKTVFIPARFQYDREKNLIVDGAHNVDAAIMLRKNTDFYFPDKKKIWVYGTISTKEYEKITDILFQNGDTVYLADFNYPLAVNSETVQKCLKNKQLQINKLSKTENILKNIASNSIIIITGSFYMLKDLTI